MGAEYLYYAALALIVAPSMGINPMAVLIASLWAVGQPAYLTGIDASVIDVVLDVAGLIIGICLARSEEDSDLLTALLFAPMFAVHAAVLVGNIRPYYAWWAIYYLAFFQIGTMLAGNDWGEGKRLLSELSDWRYRVFA